MESDFLIFRSYINNREGVYDAVCFLVKLQAFAILFSLATGIIKKLLKITRNKKKKHDKILMLAKNKFNSTESLVSRALTEISHEEFITILQEKDKYEKKKENIRNASEKLGKKQENMRVDSVNSREITSL